LKRFISETSLNYPTTSCSTKIILSITRLHHIHEIQKCTRYKIYQLDTKIHQCNKMYKIQTIYTHKPSMPQMALTPFGLPSLATNHKST